MFALVATLLIGAALLAFASSSVRYIPNNRVAIVEKLWSAQGSVKRGLIALNGEAGFQPERAARRLHFFIPVPVPRAHRMPLVTIPQGKIGYVFARDGAAAAADPDAGLATRAPPTSRTRAAS